MVLLCRIDLSDVQHIQKFMINRNFDKIPAVVMAMLVMAYAGGGHAQIGQTELLERERGLKEKAARLRQEQDFLLFQKEFYLSDSKYLILDLEKGRGMLKYKNRLLKAFSFTPTSWDAVRPLPPGQVVLTKKIGSDHRRLTLIFGQSFIVQSKPAAHAEKGHGGMPRLYLKKGDMLSLFYALEVGARAFIRPPVPGPDGKAVR